MYTTDISGLAASNASSGLRRMYRLRGTGIFNRADTTSVSDNSKENLPADSKYTLFYVFILSEREKSRELGTKIKYIMYFVDSALV